MKAYEAADWVIDDRTHYDWPAGGHQEPLQLGAVVAECPTSFGGHTIRDRSTIGKPCPTVAEGDAIGLANAHLCKAAPKLLAACEAFVIAWEKSLQLEKTDHALMLAKEAIAIAKGEVSLVDIIHERGR